jgi:RNA polymerase sigma-70 factor (ECF subfamily)
LQDFEQIVEKHQDMVFRTLARLTGEREGLEDMAQEAFLRLFKALPHFREDAAVTTYLYRIIVNVVNDEFRERKKVRMMSPIEDAQGRELVSSAAGATVQVERAQLQEALEARMLELPAGDRAILTLHYQEGRSYEEIAAILDLKMGTVKTHLFRAREKLRNTMKGWSR